MNTTPDVWAFLKELFQRLGQKTPAFFKVIGWISTAIAVLTGLPIVLADLGITLPDAIQAFANKTIAIAAIVGKVISMLTVKDATNVSGPTNMPLTDKKDK
jgi:hypothetical protein